MVTACQRCTPRLFPDQTCVKTAVAAPFFKGKVRSTPLKPVWARHSPIITTAWRLVTAWPCPGRKKGPLACPGMAKIFLSAWPGQHPASPAGNAVKPIFASGGSEGGRDGSSETHCGALPSAAAEEESQTQIRPSLQTPTARQPRKVLSPDQGGSTEAKASQVIGWQPANAHLRTDLPATCSAMHLHRSSSQKSGASPFLSHVSVLCRLPGAPGTFRCPRSTQHHRYGYCPAPLFPQDFWPSVPRCVGHLPAPLWVSPSALQHSQPITSSLALGETQSRTLLAAHASGRSWWPQPMPTPANEDIPTGSCS